MLATIIAEANKEVAIRFNFSLDNAPKHPSFCTPAWIEADFQRKVIYFLYLEEGEPLGCVAYEPGEPGIVYLNRLSVLPQAQRRGIGAQLVAHHLDYARQQGAQTISIGIIDGHTELKHWYNKQGFIAGTTKTFDHLPFAVCYMTAKL